MNINRIIVTSNFDIIIKTSNNRLEKINLYTIPIITILLKAIVENNVKYKGLFNI